MTHEQWIERYRRAWETADEDEIAGLFTPDAWYRSSVFREPFTGPRSRYRVDRAPPGGRGIGRALVVPVLQRADHERLPCYLETFVPGNVPFYEHLGFRVADSATEPLSHVPFWAMRRGPVGATSTTDRSAQ